MNIAKIGLVILLALSTWVNYHEVGKPRKPVTIGQANMIAVLNGIFALLVVAL